MKKLYSLLILMFSLTLTLSAQKILITEKGNLEQVYGEVTESEILLPFNDLNIEFGYVLYQTDIEVELEEAILELENVRDYAVIYLDDKLQGTVTDNNKKLTLSIAPGKYTLRIYTENIGRITYGPEILDNSKGLFGNISLDSEAIENWVITPLNVRDCDVNSLQYGKQDSILLPSFHKGSFNLEVPKDTYLDISGWGMGEVWINGNYIGSYWEEEKQQSIQIPAENLLKGNNEVVVFDLKNNNQKKMKLSDNAVFK
ncbi:MAG: hypothetical protein E6767_06690 [Dysgonomonas sp.]|nr:hypothetical protein [Dysgonomonas sp.]